MGILIARKHLGLVASEPDPPDLGTLISLMHFNDTPGSSVFTDEVPGRVWTEFGTDLYISNTHAKFGDTSLICGLAGYTRLITDSTDFNLGEAGEVNFEMDIWFYLVDANGGGWGNPICTWRPDVATGPSLAIGGAPTSNTGKIMFEGTSDSLISTTAPTLNTWHHLLINRHDGWMRMFLDGVKDAEGTVVGTASPTTTPFALAGSYYGGSVFRGWLDEFRFVIGAPERTEDFTPPVAPYTYP